jgi:hypothetical protein
MRVWKTEIAEGSHPTKLRAGRPEGGARIFELHSDYRIEAQAEQLADASDLGNAR